MLKTKFQQFLKVERQYAPNTQKAYLRDLADFDAWLESQAMGSLFDEEGILAITHRHIRSWMGELLHAGISRRSVARKVSTLKTYFQFLQRQELITRNPANRVKVPKFDKKLPVFLKETETESLFDVFTFDNSFEGIRDRCMLEILYGCGLRKSELINLRIIDVDVHERSIKVLGKGNKERILPYGKHVAEALKRYLAAAEGDGIELSENLFVRKSGEKLYPKLLYNIVRKYLQQVSVQNQKSPHVLRHTFATHLLDHGADLNAIKELLGHSSLASTQVYTHNSIQKLKSVHKQAHPRASNHKDELL
ncbi:tyrosine-type recombinase/integrase [Pontibacter sp. G13]|uniref:tyrosine-type recombinase/integrase n=1 Tax=Pontibacter sp. G13 TaxID=3074898 RepID=UPI00288AFBFD|nr:tyrosine-type recombinase/integrase [Pontibacter sp. G13]WNJ19234.1 tyrosine-type recombinase/integrase [Pontibacter sp. G13]